jgi:hypothetical protein
VNQSPDSRLLRGRHNILSCERVRVLKRFVSRLSDNPNQVNHSVNARQSAIQAVSIQNVSGVDLGIVAGGHLVCPPGFPVARQNADRVSGGAHLKKHFPADKAGCACHEDFHPRKVIVATDRRSGWEYNQAPGDWRERSQENGPSFPAGGKKPPGYAPPKTEPEL